MSICCPYRHVSYATWRFQTFQWLFAASNHPSTAPQTQVDCGNGRRRISSSPQPRAYENVAPEARAESTRQGRGVDDTSHSQIRHGCVRDDGTKVAVSGARHGQQSELRRFSKTEELQQSQLHDRASPECAERRYIGSRDTLAMPERRTRQKNMVLKLRHKRRPWSPYDERGKGDLGTLAVSLQESLETSELPSHDGAEATTQLKPSTCLPVSPLVQALERKHTKKSPFKGGKEEELAHNPWAKMLASPIRLCSATGVRLPKDLLVPWGLVKNPVTEEVYFMPTELAELDSLRDKRKSSKPVTARRPTAAEESLSNQDADSSSSQANANAKSDKEKLEVDLATSHRQENLIEGDRGPDGGRVGSQAFKASPPRSSTSMVYMLPFLPLLHHLTLRFTSLQRDMVTRRSRPNAINSILPWRLKTSVDRTNFYAEQRANTGLSSAPKKATNASSPLSFQHVKWEVDIDKVMLRILRERILAALEMLGNRNQKLWRQHRELVKAIRVTRTSDMNDKEHFWRLLDRDDSTQTELVPEAEEGPDANTAQLCLLIEEDGAKLPILPEAVERKIDQGYTEHTSQVSQSTNSFTGVDDRQRAFSDLEPSTIAVDQSSSVPLFSLNDLLDADYISRFRQLSASIGVLAPRNLASGEGKGNAYVLVVPAKAFGGMSVIEEVWRLWRFLGGKRL
jgi:hypothetical protein